MFVRETEKAGVKSVSAARLTSNSADPPIDQNAIMLYKSSSQPRVQFSRRPSSSTRCEYEGHSNHNWPVLCMKSVQRHQS